MSQEVSCDICNEAFEMNINERNHPGLIIETYIKCPHCDSEFITHVTDPHARKEQIEIGKLNDRYIKKRGKLSIHMDKLKNKIIEDKASN